MSSVGSSPGTCISVWRGVCSHGVSGWDVGRGKSGWRLELPYCLKTDLKLLGNCDLKAFASSLA